VAESTGGLRTREPRLPVRNLPQESLLSAHGLTTCSMARLQAQFLPTQGSPVCRGPASRSEKRGSTALHTKSLPQRLKVAGFASLPSPEHLLSDVKISQ
jgi:hypothetical protein